MSRFYVSSKEYLFGRSTKNVDIPHFEFEAQGVQALAQNSFVGKERDERSSSIELQFDHDIDIRQSAIGIILPQQYLKLPEVIRALKSWNIPNIRYYDTLNFFNNENRIGQLYEIVKTLYIDLGYIEKSNNDD